MYPNNPKNKYMSSVFGDPNKGVVGGINKFLGFGQSGATTPQTPAQPTPPPNNTGGASGSWGTPTVTTPTTPTNPRADYTKTVATGTTTPTSGGSRTSNYTTARDAYFNALKSYEMGQNGIYDKVQAAEFIPGQMEGLQRARGSELSALERSYEEESRINREALDRASKGSGSGGVNLSSPQKTAINQVDTVLTSMDDYSKLYSTLVNKGGGKIFGEDASRLNGAYNALIFQIAQAAGTGALQAADREIVEKMIPLPTNVFSSFGQQFKGGRTGGLSAISEARNLMVNKKGAILSDPTNTSNYISDTQKPPSMTLNGQTLYLQADGTYE